MFDVLPSLFSGIALKRDEVSASGSGILPFLSDTAFLSRAATAPSPPAAPLEWRW